MLLIRSITTPVKIVRGTVRFIGYRRVAVFGAGAVFGALVTPVSGADLRRRIMDEINSRRAGTEPSIEERVRNHLAKSPRTWHLARPEVVAVTIGDTPGWEIILAGEVADEDAKRDLEQATLAVTGVATVDNRLRVVDPPAPT